MRNFLPPLERLNLRKSEEFTRKFSSISAKLCALRKRYDDARNEYQRIVNLNNRPFWTASSVPTEFDLAFLADIGYELPKTRASARAAFPL